MKIDRISDLRPETPDTEVTVKLCGNVTEIRYMPGASTGCVIEKVNAELYVDRRTGEVKQFQHRANRAGDTASVKQSIKRLRDLINTNVEDPDTALWVTLTYAENMTDSKRLYQDYRKFWQRLKYFLKKCNYPTAEYIIAAEPQGRGAWHLHCLFLFPEKAPFIPNAEIERLWRHGFTKTKSLKGVNDPGLYLTAYLADMEISEAIQAGTTKGQLKVVESTETTGQKQKKAIIKGARISRYPPMFNLYRTSRNIKRPQIYHMTENEAQEIIGETPLTYEKTIAGTDAAGTTWRIINYRTYTRKATSSNDTETENKKVAHTGAEEAPIQ